MYIYSFMCVYVYNKILLMQYMFVFIETIVAVALHHNVSNASK